MINLHYITAAHDSSKNSIATENWSLMQLSETPTIAQQRVGYVLSNPSNAFIVPNSPKTRIKFTEI